MATTKRSRRSDEEWLRIITECRQSGLSDNTWCEQNDIPLSSFYNAVSRLRKKACAVPEASRASRHTLDLTSRQDVVQINLCEDDCLPAGIPLGQEDPAAHLDNPYMIELSMGSVSLKIGNGADISLLGQMLRLLGAVPC